MKANKNVKRMTKTEAMQFINSLRRAEIEAPYNMDIITGYLKAVRVTLWALGYDELWVNGEFRNMMEEALNPEYQE